jgi:hypothetical protein
MRKFLRVERIVEARQQTAMDFLREHEKAHIDGRRVSDPRLGWVIGENGVEVWVSDEEFNRSYRPIEE